MAASGRAVRSNSKSTGMNADIEVWQPREKVRKHILYIMGGGGGWGVIIYPSLIFISVGRLSSSTLIGNTLGIRQ